MLHWSVKWIKERKLYKEEPPVHSNYSAINLPAKFNCYEEYKRLFLPLILLEMWSFVSGEADEKEARGGEDVLPVMVQEITTDSKFRRFTCCSLLTEVNSFLHRIVQACVIFLFYLIWFDLV